MNVYVQCDVCSCPVQKGQLGCNLVSRLTRDVCSCPGQKGQLGPGTLGGNLVSGLTQDVWSCPGQKGTTWTVVGRLIHGGF